jgi:hypothetical protein
MVGKSKTKTSDSFGEIPKRLGPRPETVRELYLKSGNLCAFPDCDALMMNEDDDFIGQICHIEAVAPDGERFNPNMSNEERRSGANLMLMCYPHHRQTNDVAKYSVADLKRMKAAHEQKFSSPDRAMRERAARLSPAALIGAGIAAAIVVDRIVKEINSLLEGLVHPSDDRPGEPVALRKDVEQSLRYAPAGTIYFFSRDPLHLAVGDIFLEIFKKVGWRVHRLDEPSRSEQELGSDFDHSMLMIFALKDSHQLPVARQAIDELFARFGFVHGQSEGEAVRRNEGYLLTFYLPVGVETGSGVRLQNP